MASRYKKKGGEEVKTPKFGARDNDFLVTAFTDTF
jgi:hypothetical protein